MRIMKTFISIIIFVTLIVSGCVPGPGYSDYEIDLPNNYQLVRISGHDIKVVPNGGWTSEDQIIVPKVIEIAWDKRFIIAKQNGLKKAYQDTNNTYEIPDPSIVNYWILDTLLKKRYGPYDLDSFNQHRKKLSINDNLSLKDVNSYNKN